MANKIYMIFFCKTNLMNRNVRLVDTDIIKKAQTQKIFHK